MNAKIGYKRGDSDNRPWGKWEVLDVGEQHIVKRIWVNPGQVLSYQYHDYRNENWVIVKGVATITLADDIFKEKVGGSVFIPAGTNHRIANDESDEVLEFIEVQTGSVLSEDDIVRLQDSYGRA